MKQLRQLHLYLGVFFAPAILFFAFSGALQTFSLHESEEGESYTPPAWVVAIASIHKDQHLPHHKAHAHPAAPVAPAPEAAIAPAASSASAASSEARPPQPDEHEHEGPSPLPLKCFVLLLSIGLMTTALLGIYMALQNRNNRRNTWITLAAGVVVPIAMLFL